MTGNVYFDPPSAGQPGSPEPPAGQSKEARPAVPPTPLVQPMPQDVGEQLRQARRELRIVQGELAREREQLERVRDVLAAQRLTKASNEEQIATWRERINAERQREQVAVAELTRRHAELDATLGQRRADLLRQVAELERAAAELTRSEQEKSARLAAMVEQAKRDADRIRQAARAEVLKLRESAEAIMRQARESADQQAQIIVAGGRAKADELKFQAERELSAATEEARQLRDAASTDRAEAATELQTVTATAQAQADAIIDAARKQAEQIRTSTAAESSRARESAQAALEQARASAEAIVRQARESANQQANVIVAGGQSKADELKSQAEQELAAACAEIDRLNKSATAERDRQQRELSARVSAEETRLGRADAEFRRRCEQFEHDTATMRDRLAKLASDEAAAASERARLAEHRAELDRDRADVDSCRSELAGARQKFESDVADFARERAENIATLARRSEELDTAMATLHDLEQSLADRDAALTGRRQHLDEQAEAIRINREQLDAERARRLADVERGERELHSARAELAQRQQHVESRETELEQALRDVEVETRQLRRDQDATRRQRDEAEALARDLATRGEKLTATERQVISGWEEVRRAKTAMAASQERLDRDRQDFLARSRPLAKPVKQVGLPWRAYRRWATGLVAATCIALAVTLLTIWSAVQPYYQAAGRMTLAISGAGGESSAGQIASAELSDFLAARGTPASREGGSLVAGQYRIDGLDSGGRNEITLRVLATGTGDSQARELADRLIRDFSRWRDDKLRPLGDAVSLDELNRERDRRLADVRSARDAERVAREQIGGRRGMPANLAGPAGVLAAIEARLAELSSALDRDHAELDKLATQRVAWRAEIEQITAAGITEMPEPPANIERNLHVDRTSMAQTQRRIEELKAKLEAARESAESEWRQASAGLVSAIRGHANTGDQTVVDAVTRFGRAQSAYLAACQATEQAHNPLLKTWTEQAADLAERIAVNEKLVSNLAEARAAAARLIDAKAKLDASGPRFEQLLADVERHRSGRLELLADRQAYQPRAEALAVAETQLRAAEARLDDGRRLATAQIKLAVSPASIETFRNPRPQWMLIGACVVLVVAALFGWLIVVMLARPREMAAIPLDESRDDAGSVPLPDPAAQTT